MAVVHYNPWDNARGGPCVVGGVTSRRPEEDRRDQLSTNQWRCRAALDQGGRLPSAQGGVRALWERLTVQGPNYVRVYVRKPQIPSFHDHE